MEFYKCTLSLTVSIGSIAIDGRSFKFTKSDGEFSVDYPFELTEAGEIIWYGPLGLMSKHGNKIGKTKLIDSAGGFAGFNVFLRTSQGVHRIRRAACGIEE